MGQIKEEGEANDSEESLRSCSPALYVLQPKLHIGVGFLGQRFYAQYGSTCWSGELYQTAAKYMHISISAAISSSFDFDFTLTLSCTNLDMILKCETHLRIHLYRKTILA